MLNRMTSRKGFTMVELLIVLVIVGILAAVATPIYLANVKKSRASEAVATMALMRQSLRDFKISSDLYFDVAQDHIQDVLPQISKINPSDGSVSSTTSGLDVDAGTAQYFSNAAFSVNAAGTSTSNAGSGSSGLFSSPPARDFIILADGGSSTLCSGATINCATKSTEVGSYQLEMDNSGRIFVTYDGGATWAAY